MGTITLRDFPNQILQFELPNVIDDEIIIDVYDDVTGLTITNCNSNEGFSTNVEGNNKDLSEFSLEIGKYDIEIHTQSEGVLEQTIEIEDSDTSIIFNKIDFEFQLVRVDDECLTIENTDSENLSETFVTTDNIRIKFEELNDCSLTDDGYSYDDIVWKIEGVTSNDGNPTFSLAESNSICEFIPNPINRPTTGSSQHNDPIKYIVKTQILGLRKVFELEQDGKSVLIQEYIDYGTTWTPGRNEIFADNGIWNTGNYSTNANYNENAANYPYDSGYIAATGNNRFQEIWDELVENYGTLCIEAGIDNEGLAVNSCYRNPQRNRDVGSVLINSNHTIGHAMDVRTLGARTSQKWILLNNAAEQINGVNGICENGPTQIPCGSSNQSHVHLAW